MSQGPLVNGTGDTERQRVSRAVDTIGNAVSGLKNSNIIASDRASPKHYSFADVIPNSARGKTVPVKEVVEQVVSLSLEIASSSSMPFVDWLQKANATVLILVDNEFSEEALALARIDQSFVEALYSRDSDAYCPIYVATHQVLAICLLRSRKDEVKREADGVLATAIETCTSYVDRYSHREHTALATSFHTLGMYLNSIGKPEEAMKTASVAVHIKSVEYTSTRRRNDFSLARSLYNLAIYSSESGDYEKALQSVSRAADIQTMLVSDDPSDEDDLADSLSNFALYLSKTGRYKEAVEKISKTVDIRSRIAERKAIADDPIYTRLATALHRRASYISKLEIPDYKEASESAARSVEIRTKLREHDSSVESDLAESLSDLAFYQAKQGRYEEASENVSRVVDYKESAGKGRSANSDFADLLHRRAMYCLKCGTPDYEKAADSLRKAVEIRTKLAEAATGDDSVQSDLSNSREKLAWALTQMGRYEEAVDVKSTAVDTWDKLLEGNPTPSPSVAGSLSSFGEHLSKEGDYEKAAKSFRKAVEMQTKLAKKDPSIKADLTSSLCLLADCTSKQGDVQEAAGHLSTAAEIQTTLAEKDSSIRPALSSTLGKLARFSSALGDNGRAVESMTRATKVLTNLAEERPSVKVDLASSLHSLSTYLSSENKYDEALLQASKAVDIQSGLVDETPIEFRDSRKASLSDSLQKVAEYSSELGDYDKAVAHMSKVVEIQADLAGRDSSIKGNLANSRQLLADYLSRQGNDEEALKQVSEAADIQSDIKENQPIISDEDDIQIKVDLSNSYAKRAQLSSKVGNYGDAVKYMSKALSIREVVANDFPSMRINVLTALYLLGEYASKRNDYQSAFKHIQKALGVRKAMADVPGSLDVGVASACRNFADHYARRRNFKEADKWEEMAICFAGFQKKGNNIDEVDVSATIIENAEKTSPAPTININDLDTIRDSPQKIPGKPNSRSGELNQLYQTHVRFRGTEEKYVMVKVLDDRPQPTCVEEFLIRGEHVITVNLEVTRYYNLELECGPKSKTCFRQFSDAKDKDILVHQLLI